ncbi:uncharacterized protein L203_102631 [Cryptococcus depauperatus CBS 7841]|uniref:Uncharacterized protein n=1 Tax=Cryptococcus depauperatus CBS 7841 TaxID=1295531 RepID=A0A1E3IDS9_9TREE|nr:hypothetical protein L203_03996 [Cryptococcus depauperatus CBS 7841]
MLPKGVIVVNVGLRTLILSDDLLEYLAKNHLFGDALDVIDPEPLPNDHPLYSHPKCIISPLVKSIEGEMKIAVEMLFLNIKRLEQEKEITKTDKWEGVYYMGHECEIFANCLSFDERGEVLLSLNKCSFTTCQIV